jgi:chromate reductase, NAD(P)H dehydrogenase (quinone)
MRLLGIVGSLRKGSWNRALLRAITHNLPPHVTLDEYTRLANLPLFDPDDKSIPEPVADFQKAIREADGIVIATPEYNYSIPGFLKNAIDWASRPPSTSPLRGKPAAVVSASIGISGGMRAQYHLRQILVYTNTPVLAQPEVIIPRCHERFDGSGHLSDESTHDLLKTFGMALADWVARLGPRA